MSKKVSIEIRQKVLTLLKQGARSRTVSKQLGLARVSVENWQAAFDRGDVSWSLDNSRRKRTEAMAWEAVRVYAVCKSYSAAGCAFNQARQEIEAYCAYYNEKRIQAKLSYRSPRQFREAVTGKTTPALN